MSAKSTRTQAHISRGVRLKRILLASLIVSAAIVACTDTIELAGPREQNARSKRFPIVPRGNVVVDTFETVLDAQPGDTAVMHYYADVVYAEIRVEDSIILKTNPTNPGHIGPVNNTDGPVWAYGSFVAGGSCGLYVTIAYPAQGTYKKPILCDQHRSWVDTILAKGAGTAIRGPAIIETVGACNPDPCHWQFGKQRVFISALPTKLLVTPDKGRFIQRGQNVKFSVTASPNNMSTNHGGVGDRVE